MEQQTSPASSSAKVIWELPDDETQWDDEWSAWSRRDDNDGFIAQVIRGREGLNEGLGNGLTTVNTYIHGTHRGRYILIGADSGVGKTTLTDFMYVYSLWKAARLAGIRLYIKYFSYEISAVEKKARWVSQWIRAKYRIDLSTDYIMGRIPGMRVSDDHIKMIVRAYAIVEEILRDVTLIDNVLHPTGMLNKLVEEHYEKIGTVIRDAPKEGRTKGMIRGYKPKNPTDMTVAIVDHLALTHPEKGANTTKQVMDKWSMYGVQLRNLFGTTLINIQQFSTNMMSAYREQKKSESAIAPQRLDFGDSSYTYRDADLVFGLVKPVQFNLKTYYGYNMENLGQYFIAMHLMKNRYGPSDRVIPLFTNPIAGMFYDIPTNPQSDLKFFNEEAKRLEILCRQFSSQPETSL